MLERQPMKEIAGYFFGFGDFNNFKMSMGKFSNIQFQCQPCKFSIVHTYPQLLAVSIYNSFSKK